MFPIFIRKKNQNYKYLHKVWWIIFLSSLTVNLKLSKHMKLQKKLITKNVC